MQYKTESDLRKAGFLPSGEVVRMFEAAGLTLSSLQHLRHLRRVDVASVRAKDSKYEQHWYNPAQVAKHFKMKASDAKKPPKGLKIRFTAAEREE